MNTRCKILTLLFSTFICDSLSYDLGRLLSFQSQVSISVSPSQGGNFVTNNFTVFDISGDYLPHLATLIALPATGYTFSHWEINRWDDDEVWTEETEFLDLRWLEYTGIVIAIVFPIEYTITANFVSVVSVDELAFTLNDNGTEYSVTNCNTSASCSLVIPSIYIGLPVTAIGENAFYQCNYLSDVTIPPSLKSIGQNAFGGCSSLNSIIIPDGVTSIAVNAFDSSAVTTMFFSQSLLEAARAERDARPTQAEYDSIVAERDAKVTLDEVADIRPGSTMIEVSNNQATIQLQMEESSDLESWTETGDPATMTIPVPAEAGTKFFRFKMTD